MFVILPFFLFSLFFQASGVSATQMYRDLSLPEPFLKYIYEKDSNTGKKVIKSIELSDGTTIDDPDYLKKVLAAFKKATGSNEYI